MLTVEGVTQPHGQSNKELIAETLKVGGIGRIDLAVAYVTDWGAADLLRVFSTALGAQNSHVRKRWLVALDYCRTDPPALEKLMNTPKTLVRVHDSQHLLSHGCVPKTPFHAKTFIFTGKKRHAVFAGSGNASRSGLSRGHEVGILLDVALKPAPPQVDAHKTVKKLQSWFGTMWTPATPLTGSLLDQYSKIYYSKPNLQHPTPTDDDQAAPNSGRNSLTPLELRQLRVCKHLWIEAHVLTKNFGKNKPGNQIMLKRMTRVFFGIPAEDVPRDSPLGTVAIRFMNNPPKTDCSLTYSNNSMDKLTLPNPATGGPPSYDNETLIFERISPNSYSLRLATAKEKQICSSKSAAIGANHTMAQGRRWGVF